MARILFPLSFAGSALVLVVLGLAGCGPKKTPEAAASPGTSMETAIQVCGPSGRRTYLARLTCPGEDPVGQATLSGSVGPRADGHPVDHLQVNCPDGTAHEIFMDMEHCEDADPLQEVGGLGVLPPPPPPELVPWEPGEGGIPMDAVARVPEQGVLLEVVDVGSEPRRVLRYTPVPGQQEQVRMRMLMAMEMTIAGNSGGRMMLPVMIMDMDMVVTDVSDHEIVYEADVTQATVDRSGDMASFPPEMLVELETALKPLEGMTGTARISDRGESLDAVFTLPKDAPEELAQQMSSFSDSAQNMAVPVPLEAVGEGARWSVYSQVNSNGFRIVQRADVLLAELEEDRISLEMTIVQQPLEANPQMSSLPPGTEMEMLRFTSEGSAASVIELGRLVPIEASSSVGMDFAFAMVGEGQRVEAEMSMDMSMELSRLE